MVMNMRHRQQKTVQGTQAAPTLQFAAAAQKLASSPTLAINEAIAERRAAGREGIHVGFGEATFHLHPLLDAALGEASKHTGYAPVWRLPALRQAIANYMARTRGLNCSSEHIVIGPGSKPLLYALLHVLEGDLLLPVPSWVSYAPQARLAGRRVITVQTDAVDHHRLTQQALSEALAQARKEGADPRILVVNTPSNPTGSMFDRADVEALASWARDAGITVISDEIYAELAHGWREHISPACFYPQGCIVTGGLSKAFSAGGWRVGYAVLPPGERGAQAVAALRALASEIWSAAATPMQEAAIVAFTPNADLETYVRRSARIHAHSAARLYEMFHSLGVPCPRPAGAFYLYPDFAPWRTVLAERGVKTGQELAHYLLDKWDIAALPGSAFGEQLEALRLRLATSMLYNPGGAHATLEREAALWRLLDLADTVSPLDHASGPALPLPMLERAQARLTEFMRDLGTAVKEGELAAD